MNENAKILRRAAELIEQGWCQHTPAKTERGLWTYPEDEQAVSWCLTGAIERAASEITGVRVGNGYAERLAVITRYGEPLVRLDASLRGHSAPLWNNDPSRTANEVTALLRRAADAEEARA